MSQERELIKLQQLLIAEIIEKGYDQDEFETYLARIAPEKTDLDQWTFLDLQLNIFQFQDQKVNSTQREKSEIKVSKLFPKTRSAIREKKQVSINDNQIEEFDETINCIKEKYVIEKDQKLEFDIVALKQGNKYLNKFTITTKPQGWLVERSKADFLKLYTILTQLFPELIIRKFQFDEKPENIVQTLYNFLQLLNQQEILRTEIICLYFLHRDAQGRSFEELCTQFSQIKIYSLQKKQTLTGQINVNFTLTGYERYLQIQQYVSQFGQKHQSLQLQFKETQKIINKAETSLDELSKSLSQLLELLPFQELRNTEYRKQLPFKAISLVAEFQQSLHHSKILMTNVLSSIFDDMQESLTAQVLTIDNCEKIKKGFVSSYGEFMNSQNQHLKKKEIQEVLHRNKQLKFAQNSNQISMPGIDYGKLCLILRQEQPLYVPVEFEVQQQKKLEFAYMIQETCAGVEKLFQLDTVRYCGILDDAMREIMAQCDRRKEFAQNILKPL